MAVTEVAILHLQPGAICDTPERLQQCLQEAKRVQEHASGYPAYYFQQIEETNVLYIVGSWASTAAHFEHLPSQANQNVLASLEGLLETGEGAMVMFHLDVDVTAELTAGKKIADELLRAPVVSVERYHVKDGGREAFECRMGEVKPLLEGFTAGRPVVGGFRIEKETVESGVGAATEREEWVLLSGFKSVEHHQDFSKSKDWEKYSTIMDVADGFEIKHMRLLPL